MDDFSNSKSQDERYHREEWMSDDQWGCAQVAADLKRGFHHVSELSKCGEGISFHEPNEIATFDFDLMTRAVALAHRHAVRIGASAREIEEEFEGSRYKSTKLVITVHPRDHMADRMSLRHPSLSNLAEMIGFDTQSTADLKRQLDEARGLLRESRKYVVSVCQAGRIPIKDSPNDIVARIDALTADTGEST